MNYQTSVTAYVGATVFDGHRWHEGSALLVRDGLVEAIVSRNGVPLEAMVEVLDGGMVVPGFVDLQVNGGGGALLNDVPTIAGIATICSAHAQFGTTALLPTLITDTMAITEQAIVAGQGALAEKVKGFLGLHLEGPHLSIARKGAHDPALIRPMDDNDLARLIAARQSLPNLLCTVAAETVTPTQIAALRAAGIIVSIGHSDATAEIVGPAVAAGATMATHLFNAMSQLGNREPGVVGTVLTENSMFCGIIADGIHVHPTAIKLALAAKAGHVGKVFLVTDAMSLTGTNATSFTLNGRTITRSNGALRLADGTLAGADLTMIDAIAYMHQQVGISLEEALRMASLYPAEAMGIEANCGHLGDGARASFVHLGANLNVQATWIDGDLVFRAQ